MNNEIMRGQILLWVAVCIAVVLFIISVVWINHSHQHKRFVSQITQRRADPVDYAFIINPSKPHAEEIRQHIKNFCSAHSILNPLFIDTLLTKDGYACAKEAIATGAHVIVACGGDGTVRTVANAVAETNCTLGVIPMGTANLFARNVGIPIDNIDEALQIVISHGSRRIDMGHMVLSDSKDPSRHHGFLLISGIGFDAAMINSTNPVLKKHIGWLAYFAGAVKHLNARHHRGTIIIRQRDGRILESKETIFRTFLAGNCGKIPIISLLPQADYSDGMLDFALLNTKAGLLGWTSLANDIFYQTISHKPGGSPLNFNSDVKATQGVSAELFLDEPALAQVDGDILGHTKHVIISITQRALLIRVPVSPSLDETGLMQPIS